VSAVVNGFHPEGRGVHVAASVLGWRIEASRLKNVTRLNVHEGNNSAVIVRVVVIDLNRKDLGELATRLSLGDILLEVGVSHPILVIVQALSESGSEVVNHGNTLAGFLKKSSPFFNRVGIRAPFLGGKCDKYPD
jgi:hypothetical protein